MAIAALYTAPIPQGDTSWAVGLFALAAFVLTIIVLVLLLGRAQTPRRD